jgi:metal-responsive CopG/Arc/MetJ family transcriptional regulator
MLETEVAEEKACMAKRPPREQPVSIRFSKDVLREVDRLAEEEQRSRSQMIDILLQRLLLPGKGKGKRK